MRWIFFVNSVLLGVGLAMDAFSVSLANGLADPGMSRRRSCGIAGTFAMFQFAMPMLGWICVHTIIRYFEAFQHFIPWIALLLLLYIGGKMLLEGVRSRNGSEEVLKRVSLTELLIQGVATSIDALSVGFTIAYYGAAAAFAASLIIAVTTFFVCIGGVLLGRTFGTRLSGKASILGGVILILIGIEIFLTGI